MSLHERFDTVNMTKLLIKQRVFSWTDAYDIYDESGNPKYYVKADFFTLGHRLHIYDYATNSEIGMIREKLMTWLAKAEITVGGRVLGIITRKWTFLRPKYSIEYNGWQVDGNFLEWNYKIVDQNGIEIAAIDKEIFHWGDTYALTIYDDSDEQNVLIMALTIDMLNCGQR